MISLHQVLKIHEILLEKFGGLNGVRDIGLVESAIERPIKRLTELSFIQPPSKKQALYFKV